MNYSERFIVIIGVVRFDYGMVPVVAQEHYSAAPSVLRSVSAV